MIEEIAQMQKEERIIYNSMFYSYMVLTKQATVKELFESSKDFGLLFHPEDLEHLKGQEATDIIDCLIDFFIEIEEYEKCQDLVDIKELYK
tara:strand:+ start:320 stop:592 length:273 start_codon:yes stop_codon:yes gene_type:complete